MQSSWCATRGLLFRRRIAAGWGCVFALWLVLSGCAGSRAAPGGDDGGVAIGASVALTIIRAGAEWCAPCREMERITWSNRQVQRELQAAGAKVIELDIDDDPVLAGHLAIRGVPTVIARRGDEEVARFTGLRDAEWFLEWFRGLHGGQNAIEVARERVFAAKSALMLVDDPDPVPYWSARVDLAIEYERAGRVPESLELVESLWHDLPEIEAMPNGASASTRSAALNRFFGLTWRLAERGPETERQLQHLAVGNHADSPAGASESHFGIEGTEEDNNPSTAAPPSLANRIRLAAAAGDHVTIAGWYADLIAAVDEDRPDDGAATTPEDVARFIAANRQPLIAALAATSRWDLLLDLIERGAPVNVYAANRLRRDSMRDRLTEHSRQMLDAEAQAEVVLLYQACLGIADAQPYRAEQAADIASSLLTHFDTPQSRFALVRAAVAVDRVGPEHWRWLKEAEAWGAIAEPSLKQSLHDALSRSSSAD